MTRRTPDGPPPPPTVQRLRIRYAKRGRLRFTSHRDFARALERALRRADLPMAYSAGFSPHPKISYIGASPTGVASEAEYLEIGLAAERDPAQVRADLDAALPDGLDVLEVVVAGAGSLADRIEASHWQIELPGVSVAEAQAALAAFLARSEVAVERLTKTGRRSIDARAAVVSVVACGRPGADHAILDLVVRQVTPSVRPDDVLAALRLVAGLAPAAPPLAVRMAQGPLDDNGTVCDPLVTDRPDVAPSPEQ
jgi:radical SAM-linked protein